MADVKRVLIVGAGIGGLTLAAALKARGIASEIVEQARTLEPVGAGISLAPNALAVLRRLGLAERLESVGHAIATARLTDAGGRTMQVTDLSALNRIHGPSLALHRGTLHQALLAGIAPTVLRLGAALRALSQGAEGVAVEAGDGGREAFDLVVGADGIHSRVRALISAPAAVRYAGYTCWRFVTALRAGIADPIEMWGRGKRMGLVPIDGGRLYGYATLSAAEGKEDPLSGRRARLRENFREFGGPAPDALASLERDDQIIHGDIVEVRMERWVEGRVALLGDAAHAMTPNLGQGAAMAIEDAAVLARHLAAAPDVASAFAGYQLERWPRVRRIQDDSRRIGQLGQWRSPMACAARDLVLRAIPGSIATRPLLATINKGISA